MKQYRGKTAIVTGAASGIGRALAEELARHGARVVVTDIDEEGARRVARTIGAADGLAEPAPLDVRDADAVGALVERVTANHGQLDYMFNNAGIAIVGEALQLGLQDYNRLIDVNLRGVIHGIHAAYPIMARQGSGHIVNTASIAGLLPAAAFSGYAATKHAVVGLSTSIRLEAARYGVHVTAVCPGLVDTPIQNHAEVRGLDRGAVQQQLPFAAYPATACARDVLRGVARNAAVVVVTPHGKMMTLLYRHAPGVVGDLLRRAVRKSLADATVKP